MPKLGRESLSVRMVLILKIKKTYNYVYFNVTGSNDGTSKDALVYD